MTRPINQLSIHAKSIEISLTDMDGALAGKFRTINIYMDGIDGSRIAVIAYVPAGYMPEINLPAVAEQAEESSDEA